MFQGSQEASATKGASKDKAQWILQNYGPRHHLGNLEMYIVQELIQRPGQLLPILEAKPKDM